MEENKVADRLLRLLDRMVRDEGKNPLNEHAAALGIPSSTAYRMVETLRNHGFLAPAERGHYVAGLTLSDFGTHCDASASLAACARPLLRRLARECRATVHLGVMDGDMITYVIKEHGGGTPLFTAEGGQLEAYCSAIGRVLLAHMADAEREAYLTAGPFVPLTRRTVIDPQSIRELLAETRERGYAIDDREIADDLVCVAVPAFRGESVVAAISLSMTDSVLELERALSALQACALKVSRRIGTINRTGDGARRSPIPMSSSCVLPLHELQHSSRD